MSSRDGQEPMVRRLPAGGKWTRNFGPQGRQVLRRNPNSFRKIDKARRLGTVAILARNRKFESTPLQQTVCLSPGFASVPGKTRVFRHFGGRAGRQRRQRRTKPSNIAPKRGGVSVGRYSSTAVLPDAVCEIYGIGRK